MEIRLIAANLRGEAGELALLRRALDGGLASERNDRELVARAHGFLQQRDGLLLRGVGAGRHRVTAIRDDDDGARAVGEFDGEMAEGEDEGEQHHRAQHAQSACGQRPEQPHRAERYEQQEPDGLQKNHAGRGESSKRKGQSSREGTRAKREEWGPAFGCNHAVVAPPSRRLPSSERPWGAPLPRHQ